MRNDARVQSKTGIIEKANEAITRKECIVWIRNNIVNEFFEKTSFLE